MSQKKLLVSVLPIGIAALSQIIGILKPADWQSPEQLRAQAEVVREDLSTAGTLFTERLVSDLVAFHRSDNGGASDHGASPQVLLLRSDDLSKIASTVGKLTELRALETRARLRSAPDSILLPILILGIVLVLCAVAAEATSMLAQRRELDEGSLPPLVAKSPCCSWSQFAPESVSEIMLAYFALMYITVAIAAVTFCWLVQSA